jgi:DnaJ-class molecular chaperone
MKYFELSDDPETLKKKYKVLAKKYHPDLYGEEGNKIMQEIHEELEYCSNKGGKSGTGHGITVFDLLNEVMDELKGSRPDYRRIYNNFGSIVSTLINDYNKLKKSKYE